MVVRTPFLVALFLALVGMSPPPPDSQTGSHLQLRYTLDTRDVLSEKTQRLTLHSGAGEVEFQGSTLSTNEVLVVWEGHLDPQKTTADVKEGGILLALAGGSLDGLCFLDDKLYRISNRQLIPITFDNMARQVLEAPYPLPPAPRADYYLESVTTRPDHPADEERRPSGRKIDSRPLAVKQPLIGFDGKTEIELGFVYSWELKKQPGVGVISFPLWHSKLVEALTNWTFRLHDLPLRVKVVGFVQSKCASTTLDRDLEKLKLDRTGGLYPSLAKADVVAWVGSYQNGCGLMRCSPILEPCEGKQAFFAVDQTCAVQHFSVAHELGHILGANHQHGYDQDQSHSKYSRGFCSASTSWRTIMAEIPDKCHHPDMICTPPYIRCLPGSTRLPFWSSPCRAYLGEVLSTAGADNSSTLRATAPRVALLNTAGRQRTAAVGEEDANGH